MLDADPSVFLRRTSHAFPTMGYPRPNLQPSNWLAGTVRFAKCGSDPRWTALHRYGFNRSLWTHIDKLAEDILEGGGRNEWDWSDAVTASLNREFARTNDRYVMHCRASLQLRRRMIG